MRVSLTKDELRKYGEQLETIQQEMDESLRGLTAVIKELKKHAGEQ